MTLPRSLAIPKTWKNFNHASFFSAFGYPALGLGLFITMIVLGLALTQLTFHWWYIPLAMAVIGAPQSGFLQAEALVAEEEQSELDALAEESSR